MNTDDRWLNRRRMAWCSLISGLAFPLILLVADTDQVSAVAVPFYLFVSSVVGLYVGYATADDKWQEEAANDKLKIDSNSGGN